MGAGEPVGACHWGLRRQLELMRAPASSLSGPRAMAKPPRLRPPHAGERATSARGAPVFSSRSVTAPIITMRASAMASGMVVLGAWEVRGRVCAGG